MTIPLTTAAAKRQARRVAAPAARKKHDDMCGCSVDMREDPTPDEELPAATGNVEGDDLTEEVSGRKSSQALVSKGVYAEEEDEGNHLGGDT